MALLVVRRKPINGPGAVERVIDYDMMVGSVFLFFLITKNTAGCCGWPLSWQGRGRRWWEGHPLGLAGRQCTASCCCNDPPLLQSEKEWQIHEPMSCGLVAVANDWLVNSNSNKL